MIQTDEHENETGPPTADRPLLSICIPTYNRANWLDSAVRAVVPQVARLGGQVELLVSDNCSPDSTPDVIANTPGREHIRYYRNEANVGACLNVDLCVKRAAGEFVWVVGDDDLVREGGVERVVKVLQDHPEVDFVYVNVSTRLGSDRERFDRPVCGSDFPELMPAASADLSERPLESWNELVDPDVSRYFLGSIMSCVFRRSLWLSASDDLDLGAPFCSSLAAVYPHSLIFAGTMVGRKAYYVGHPCVIAFGSHWDWVGYQPAILAVWLHRLLDTYEEHGVERWRIERCRRSLLLVSGAAAIHLLCNRSLPGRDSFSFCYYVKRYWRYKECWHGILRLLPGWVKMPAKALISRVKAVARAGRRLR